MRPDSGTPAPWQPLLQWWFGEGGTASQIAAQRNRLWFGYRQAQDAEARERFGGLAAQALQGGLSDWAQTPDGWLALLILLDQLPRMIHRGKPEAFAGDAAAQALLDRGLAHGLAGALAPIRQVFCYLVLEHAEDLGRQERGVVAFAALADLHRDEERAIFDDFLAFARKHRDVVARFGRFPHRNEILGRLSTEEEKDFLRRPGSRF
ncbi:DUF924 family protein [Pseudomonas sp. UBA6310]|uniref:DUF924 family protein n=1 Tax=Pseudomonas sp. UBA6310 TaxID=1947327 RepID=UPI00257CD0D9|nr:DUF924 family protein [Pseudomonas sp. UBA6310]